MKHFTLGYIYCKCSIRMHCQGKSIRIYEHTRDKQKCPNCGKKIWQSSWTEIEGNRVAMMRHRGSEACVLDAEQTRDFTRTLLRKAGP